MKKTIVCCWFLFLLFSLNSGYSQQLQVLPSDGSTSSNAGPHGSSHYQRGFYLITAAEMQAAGFANGTSITSAAFTFAAAQDRKTKGKYKLWLQNTLDKSSRID